MEYWKFLHPNLAFAGRVWASGGLIRIDELKFLKRNRSREAGRELVWDYLILVAFPGATDGISRDELDMSGRSAEACFGTRRSELNRHACGILDETEPARYGHRGLICF